MTFKTVGIKQNIMATKKYMQNRYRTYYKSDKPNKLKIKNLNNFLKKNISHI